MRALIITIIITDLTCNLCTNIDAVHLSQV